MIDGKYGVICKMQDYYYVSQRDDSSTPASSAFTVFALPDGGRVEWIITRLQFRSRPVNHPRLWGN